MLEWFNSFIVWISDPWNLLSAVMSLIGLIGTITNAERNKVGFVFWLISNLYMSIRFFVIGEYAQSGLFLAYFILAIRGIFSWKKQEDADKKAIENAKAGASTTSETK